MRHQSWADNVDVDDDDDDDDDDAIIIIKGNNIFDIEKHMIKVIELNILETSLKWWLIWTKDNVD